jgi:DNA repair REX1-B
MCIRISFSTGNVKQVIDLESMLMLPDVCRADLANLLKAVQAQEKQKLHLVSCILESLHVCKLCSIYIACKHICISMYHPFLLYNCWFWLI